MTIIEQRIDDLQHLILYAESALAAIRAKELRPMTALECCEFEERFKPGTIILGNFKIEKL